MWNLKENELIETEPGLLVASSVVGGQGRRVKAVKGMKIKALPWMFFTYAYIYLHCKRISPNITVC